MEALFYNFVKKINSTKQPTASTAVSLPIELKLSTSVLQPTILLKQINYPNYNYMYIPTFERYYFLGDRVWQNGLWEIEAKVDVLASYKFNIGNTSFYIARTSAKYDGDIIDLQYVAKTSFSRVMTSVADIWLEWADNLTEGYYLVGINGQFGNEAPQAGSISYFVLNYSQFKELMNQLFINNLNWYKDTSPLGISDSLAKMIFDPFQYIKTVRWLPFEPRCNYSNYSIKIGWWTFDPIGNIGYLSNTPTTSLYQTGIEIPKHPKTAQRGNYLNTSRFTEHIVTIPTIGIVNLPANDLVNMKYISYYLTIDPVNGETRLDIYLQQHETPEAGTQHGYLYKRVYGNVGCEIDIAQATIKFGELLKSATSIATSAVTLEPTLIAQSIANFSDLLAPPAESIGGNRGFLNFNDIRIGRMYSKFFDIVDEYNADIGRPLCEVGTLENVGIGYYELLKPDLQIGGTEREAQEAINLLERGFFYE